MVFNIGCDVQSSSNGDLCIFLCESFEIFPSLMKWIYILEEREINPTVSKYENMKRSYSQASIWTQTKKLICFNQRRDIFTKMVGLWNLWTNSPISETAFHPGKDINARLAKAWTTIARVSVLWKLDLSDKIKRSWFQATVVSILLYGCTPSTLTKRMEKKTAIAQECYEQYRINPGGNVPQNSSCTATYHPSRKPSKINEQDMWYTAGEVGTNSWVLCSCEHLHKDGQEKVDQLETIFNSSVVIQSVA